MPIEIIIFPFYKKKFKGPGPFPKKMPTAASTANSASCQTSHKNGNLWHLTVMKKKNTWNKFSFGTDTNSQREKQNPFKKRVNYPLFCNTKQARLRITRILCQSKLYEIINEVSIKYGMPWMLRLISFGNLDIKKQTNTHSYIRIILWPRITKVCVCVCGCWWLFNWNRKWLKRHQHHHHHRHYQRRQSIVTSQPTFHQSSVHLLVSEMSLLPYVLFDRCNWSHVTRNLFPWICLDFSNVRVFFFLLSVVVRTYGGRRSSLDSWSGEFMFIEDIQSNKCRVYPRTFWAKIVNIFWYFFSRTITGEDVNFQEIFDQG